MNDPRFLVIIFIVFLLLGVYNVFTGLRRQREAQLHGRRISWYRQINILTGVEYLLLSIVFMISLNLRNKAFPFPGFLRGLVVPFYLVVLAASAILAVFVIRQAMANARQMSRNPPTAVQRNNSLPAEQGADGASTPEQRAANLQRRRERRQKAAEARRRRSGK